MPHRARSPRGWVRPQAEKYMTCVGECVTSNRRAHGLLTDQHGSEDTEWSHYPHLDGSRTLSLAQKSLATCLG